MAAGASLKAYEREFRRRFGTDMLMHRLIYLAYSKLGTSGLGFLVWALSKLGFGGLLSRYGDMDSPTAFFKNMLLKR